MKDSQLCIDPIYGHVIGAVIFEGTDSLNRPSSGIVKVTTTSPISEQQCTNYYVGEEITSTLPEDISAGDRKYCFASDTVYRCPTLTITFPNHEANNLPLGEDIPVEICYEEFGGVSFKDLIEEVKFKDRFDFISVESRLTFDPVTGKATTTIRSDYPGAIKLRAKDTKYLCFFEPIEGRFKQ
jgi:hypothetical protein